MSRKLKPSNFRRHREGKTDYRRRLKLLKSKTPRVVIRKSLRQVTIQAVEYSPKGDSIILSATSKELKNFGWPYHNSNTPTAYLTGFLFGIKSLNKGIKNAILDIGVTRPIAGSKIYAALKGIIDAGLKIPSDENIMPSDERINGAHISSYAEELKKNNPTLFKSKFSKYLRNNADPTKIQDTFKSVLSAISNSKVSKKGGNK